ncbi:phosphodiester glycosidase family protein [Salininema proteolyticum]|uniref:Phosphodiester glycosidase family protein n=1 Tax=Salininema proteolyticum TaxID=1607685 RepID=A0ABV8TZV4_9ACTN
MRHNGKRTALGTASAIAAVLALAACEFGDEDGGDGGGFTEGSTPPDVTEEVAPGLVYESFSYNGEPVHMVTVAIGENHVSADVLVPDAIAATDEPSNMAEDAGAAAVINGDFFNNREDDWIGTNAPSGPMIAHNGSRQDGSGGESFVKAAVPAGQRMGPTRPESSPYESVLGFRDGTPIMTTLDLDGKVVTDGGERKLDGANQYGLPTDGIGYFDHQWGGTHFSRAGCGNEEARDAPCSDNTYTLLVRDGKVLGESTVPAVGGGEGEYALFGRDAGADFLRGLEPGDDITTDWRLVSPDGDIETAVGGMPIVRDGSLVEGLSEDEIGDDGRPENTAVRSAVGYNKAADELYMLTVGEEQGAGLSLRELGALMMEKDAVDALNLDGGGSSLLGTADEDGSIEVRNTPTDPWFLGNQREVANALAIFAAEPSGSEVSFLEGRWRGQYGNGPFDPVLEFDADGSVVRISEGAAELPEGTVRLQDDSTDEVWHFVAELEYPVPDREAVTVDFTVEPGSSAPEPQVGDVLTDSEGTEWVRESV